MSPEDQGASSTSGQFNGVQAEIKKFSLSASYVHCASHVLNLVTQKACDVNAIRNTHSAVKKNFNYSAKRTVCLQSHISPNVAFKKLKNVCLTRWVECHSAIILFVQLLGAVFDALGELSTKGDETGSQAVSLLRGMSSCEFLVALLVMENMCGLLLPLSKSLQSPAMDLSTGMRLVDDIVSMLDNW